MSNLSETRRTSNPDQPPRHALRARARARAALALLCCVVAGMPHHAAHAEGTTRPPLRLVRADADAVEIASGTLRARLRRGERIGAWTLMDVGGGGQVAVLEDFTRRDGHLVFVDAHGVRDDWPKTLESSDGAAPARYLGHSAQEIRGSDHDLLGEQILARPGDPDYETIAQALPPIRKIYGDTLDFVGAPDTFDKIGFGFDGHSPNFDPRIFAPTLQQASRDGNVWKGLVGGWLPVIRFVYPEANGDWIEMIAFAPLRVANDNPRIQPAWYRVSRIERGVLKWSRYVDTYLPFPPRSVDDARLAPAFYAALDTLRQDWEAQLSEGMQIDLPDARVADMARFGLVRAIMTRIGDFPKYGVLDRNYGAAEHDGFPDTFNVETTAMLDWGLVGRAGRYIDNYLGRFVRDDGSLMYRGPETGQYGRMLSVLARYVDTGGDAALLLRHRPRIDAITDLLLRLRDDARKLPGDDPAFGMLRGWSEADSVLEPDPERYMQPYFSNSTEAARGFRDLGRIWRALGLARADLSLQARGAQLSGEADALQRDIATATARSLLDVGGERVLPAIAGVTEPFHVAVARDRSDPQYRSYRAYMEMMYSGILPAQQIGMIADYRAHHRDVVLGMPTAYGYGTTELAGFLAYGHGYGLIEIDRVRDALLMMYSDMAHQYTRGSWLAPETRRPFPPEDAAPYCTPSQLVVTLMTRWLLVFEDPQAETLWLGKALPRAWLADGKTTRVARAPTRWGRIGYVLSSHFARGVIDARVSLPPGGIDAETRLRMRAPDGARMQSVRMNGKPWSVFDATAETVTLPARMPGNVDVEVRY